VTHVLPCTIPLSPPPLTSGRAEPVRWQRRPRTPEAHCTTRRDNHDAQARTLLFGRAEPIATCPLSDKPPDQVTSLSPTTRAAAAARHVRPPVPLSRPARGTARGRAARQGMFRSVRRAPHRSVDQRAPSPSPTRRHAPSSRCEIAAGVLPFRDLGHDPSGILGPLRPPSATCGQAVFLARDHSWQPQHPLPHREPLTVVPASSSISPAFSRHATLPHGRGIGRVARVPSSRHRASPRGARIGQMSSLAPGNTPGSTAAGQQVSVHSVRRSADCMDAGATATARTGERLVVPSGVPLSRHCGCTSRVTFDSAARRFDDPLVEPDCTVSQLGRTLIPDAIDRCLRQTTLACHCSRDGTIRRPRAVRIGPRPQAPPLDRFLVRFLLTVHQTADTPSTRLAPTDAPLAPAPGHPAEHRPSPSANQRRVAARLSLPRPLFRPCRSGQPAALDRPVPG
jgi:hypothetical protein